MGIGPSKTLEEQIKENKRNINRAIRELDRERRKLEQQEKKIEKDIKKAAKENQMDAVKIMAKVREAGRVLAGAAGPRLVCMGACGAALLPAEGASVAAAGGTRRGRAARLTCVRVGGVEVLRTTSERRTTRTSSTKCAPSSRASRCASRCVCGRGRVSSCRLPLRHPLGVRADVPHPCPRLCTRR